MDPWKVRSFYQSFAFDHDYYRTAVIIHLSFYRLSVADPEFPRRVGGGGVGGTNPKSGCKNLLFGQIFPENWMEMKEIGLRDGTHVPGAPLDPPLVI